MATVIQDTFTAPNGTQLSAHLLNSGQAWTINASGVTANGGNLPSITNNQLTVNPGGLQLTNLYSTCTVLCPTIPNAVQASFQRPDSIGFITNGMYLRSNATLATKFFAQWYMSGFDLNIYADNTWSTTTDSGGETVQLTWPVSTVTKLVRQSFDGTNLKLFFDGVQVSSVTVSRAMNDTNHRTVGFSIGSFPGSRSTIDTFTAETPVSVASSTFQEPAFFTVGILSSGLTFVAKDNSGATLPGGGDVFTASVGGSNAGSATSITDNNDGTYGIFYTPVKRGQDIPSVATSGTTTSGTTVPVNPSQTTQKTRSWTTQAGPNESAGGGAFESTGGGKFYGGVNGGPVSDDRYSKLAPIDDGAGDVNFLYRVDDIAPIIVSDTQPVNVIDTPGALRP